MASADVIQSRIKLTLYVKTDAKITPLRIKSLEEAVQEFANKYMTGTFPKLRFHSEKEE